MKNLTSHLCVVGWLIIAALATGVWAQGFGGPAEPGGFGPNEPKLAGPHLKVEVRGEYLRAFQVAHAHFRRLEAPELPPRKKKLENYYALFGEMDDVYLVWLVPEGDDPNVEGGATPLGHEVHYRIRKADYLIASWEFGE